MSTQVIFTATEGPLKGRTFAFTGKMQCLVGRAWDCDLRVPPDDYIVSRRHCLLDVDAPAVAVQDLGSLNGTYVNELLIGRRDKEGGVEEPARESPPRFLLADGDEFRVGDVVFRVRIVEEPPEADCETGRDRLMCC